MTTMLKMSRPMKTKTAYKIVTDDIYVDFCRRVSEQMGEG